MYQHGQGFQNDTSVAMLCLTVAALCPSPMFLSKRKAELCGQLISRAKAVFAPSASGACDGGCWWREHSPHWGYQPRVYGKQQRRDSGTLLAIILDANRQV